MIVTAEERAMRALARSVRRPVRHTSDVADDQAGLTNTIEAVDASVGAKFTKAAAHPSAPASSSASPGAALRTAAANPSKPALLPGLRRIGGGGSEVLRRQNVSALPARVPAAAAANGISQRVLSASSPSRRLPKSASWDDFRPVAEADAAQDAAPAVPGPTVAPSTGGGRTGGGGGPPSRASRRPLDLLPAVRRAIDHRPSTGRAVTKLGALL